MSLQRGDLDGRLTPEVTRMGTAQKTIESTEGQGAVSMSPSTSLLAALQEITDLDPAIDSPSFAVNSVLTPATVANNVVQKLR
jgi:hypothetical protein